VPAGRGSPFESSVYSGAVIAPRLVPHLHVRCSVSSSDAKMYALGNSFRVAFTATEERLDEQFMVM